MRNEEQLIVATPEDIDITLTLSGIGSRFSAAVLDMIIQLGIIFIVLMVVSVAAAPTAGSTAGEALLLIVMIITFFVVFFLYHLILELIWKGKTIGKAAFKIHVVRDGGLPLTVSAVVIRNLLRIVDFLPAFYLVGFTTLLLNKKRKRLGDLVGATIVVARPRPEPGIAMLPIAPRYYGAYERWDIAAVTDDDELLVRRFLARRHSLDKQSREFLAYELATYLRPKVMGTIDDRDPEYFLEGLALWTSYRSQPGRLVDAPAPPQMAGAELDSSQTREVPAP